MAETLTEVSSRYVDQLHATGIALQHQFEDLAEASKKILGDMGEKAKSLPLTKPKLKQVQEEMRSAILDMGPLPDSPDAKQVLLEIYLWAAVCVLGFSVGQFLGASLLRLLIGAFFNTGTTLIISMALPIWYYLYIEEGYGKNDDDRRTILLTVSLALGVLTGYNFSHLRLVFHSPSAFILPLTLGVTASFLKPELTKQRQIFLGIAVGVAVFIYIIFGMLSGSLGLRYVIWVVVAAAVTVVNLQLLLGKLQAPDHSVNLFLCQLSTVLSSVLVEIFMFYIFGVSAKKAKETPKAKPAPKAPAPQKPAPAKPR